MSFLGFWEFNVPWENLLTASGESGQTLRVLTCNVKGRVLKIQNLADLVKAARPDVVCLQECSLTDPLVVLGGEGWHCRSAGEFCLASRYPILDFEELRRPDKTYRIIAVRARLSRSGKAIPFISVHLMTPRRGLEPLIDWRGGGIDSFREIASVQRFESELLRRWVEGAPESIVLAGDFNLTAEHSLFRRDWSGYRDAFSWASWGLGHTMFTRHMGSGSITFSADQHGGHDGATLALTWARPTCPLWPTWLRVRSSARVPLDSFRRFSAIPGRPACWARELGTLFGKPPPFFCLGSLPATAHPSDSVA